MKIPMNAKPIDDLLNGGFESGILTEIYGEAGTGKTNICLQLGREIANSGKKVAYLDTEGVSMERLEQICGKAFEKIMGNFLVHKIMSIEEQGTSIEKLGKIPKIGLVVVDSVNVFARKISKEDKEVDLQFFNHIMQLQRFARMKKVPILVTAQVYEYNGEVLPFSGGRLSHIVKTIMRLEKVKPEDAGDISFAGMRRATIMKHRAIPEGKNAVFQLTGIGVD